MNSEKVLKKLFSRQSKSIELYVGSNPSVKKGEYLFIAPSQKTDKPQQRLVGNLKPRAMRGLNLFVNKALEIFTFTQNIKNFIF